MGYKVAVIGATGNVGREMLNILAEREFPADEVFAVASRKIDRHRGLLRRQAPRTVAISRISISAAWISP